MVQTNTFGANRIRLKRYGLEESVSELNRLGVSLAKEEAGQDILVAGVIGPTAEFLEPLGDVSYEEARDAFAEQATVLTEEGVDLIIIETMSALDEVKAAIEGTRQVSKLPLVCTMSFDTNLHTMMGVSPEEAAHSLSEWGADVAGANCGSGPQQTEEVIKRMRAAVPSLLLAARPNAGLPRLEGDRTVYDVGPEEFADYSLRFARMGVRLIGACCGSTPDYIKAIATRLKELSSV
jgi:5-methyltetrahydrofolate--homocysteine methyltransferase